jgi:formylglycine-generating enzyme required for sulfatase activity/DNA polymerase III delta prime subunit
MPPDREDEGFKRIVSTEMERLLEALIRLPDQGAIGRGALRQRRITVSDVFVPLRSNLSLDLLVEDGRQSRITVKVSGEHLAELRRKSPADVVSAPPLLADAFGEAIFHDCAKAAAGEDDDVGIRLQARPVIASPPWADGIKRDFASVHVAAALSAFSRVVLLGPPGSGKSTTLRAIASSLLHNPQRTADKTTRALERYWKAGRPFPFFIELKDLVQWSGFPKEPKDPSDISFEIIEKYAFEKIFNRNEYFQRYAMDKLSDGAGIFLLDGLDEIPISGTGDEALDARRTQILSLVSSMSSRYATSKIVVSSRPAGYSGWTLQGFQVIRPLPLDNREVKNLGRSLYRAAHGQADEAEKLAENLAGQITRIPKELRGQPLFVTLLANLLMQQPDAPLPTRRGDLLRESVELLLSTWSAKRLNQENLTSILGCSESQLLDRLAAIGFKATEKADLADNQEADISRADILDELYELGPNVHLTEALNYIIQHAGVLASHTERKYRFAHGQFREYLAALYISKETNAPDQIAQLFLENQIRWGEVVLLLADIFSARGSPEKIWVLISRLVHIGLPEAIVTAAKIYLDQDLGPPDVFGAVAEQLQMSCVKMLDHNSPLGASERATLLEALSVSGDPRKGLGVIDGIPEIDWIDIPGGVAMIGSSQEEIELILRDDAQHWDFTREIPPHTVTVEQFSIAKYPITTWQFLAFVEDPEGYFNRAWWHGLVPSTEELLTPWLASSRRDENRPQTYVSWLDANAFCRWLSHKTGSKITLPTEAQWEYAARGASARQFPWADEAQNWPANTLEATAGAVIGAGAYENTPSFWGGAGPADMIGNVWEWCSSAVELKTGETFDYPYRPDDGRETAPVFGTLFATRGGYFGSSRNMARCSFRGRDLADSRLGRQGFRVVLTKEFALSTDPPPPL